MIEMLGRDAAAVVFDLDPGGLVVVPGAHDDRALAGDGVGRVDQQVQEDMVDL
nr:hypothetical protein [Massilia rhizosphaerae]